MHINNIEDLLLQEMEDVRGGAGSGTCTCDTMAAASNGDDKECICKSIAIQSLSDLKPVDLVL